MPTAGPDKNQFQNFAQNKGHENYAMNECKRLTTLQQNEGQKSHHHHPPAITKSN